MPGAELHPREIGDTFPRKWERHPIHPHENGDTFPCKQELFSAKLIQYYIPVQTGIQYYIPLQSGIQY